MCQCVIIYLETHVTRLRMYTRYLERQWFLVKHFTIHQRLVLYCKTVIIIRQLLSYVRHNSAGFVCYLLICPITSTGNMCVLSSNYPVMLDRLGADLLHLDIYPVM